MSIRSTKGSAPNVHRSHFILDNAIMLLTALLLGGAGGVYYYFEQQQTRLMQSLSLQSASQYINALAEFRVLYTNQVVNIAQRQGIHITHDDKSHPDAIPLPATLSLMLATRLTGDDGSSQTRLFSPYPFPWREHDGGLKDEFDKAAWDYFQQQPGHPFFQFVETPQGEVLRYATADVMQDGCVNCHNNHPDSPKKDWQSGDVRGILSVSLPMASVRGKAESSLQGFFGLSLALIILTVAGLSFVINKLRHSVRESIRANQLLNQNNQQLEELNRELTEFSYVASHDLQEPLRTLENYTNLLKEDIGDSLNEDAKEDIHFITESTVRMRRLIQDLLTLSRTNTKEFKKEAVDLNECMIGVLENLKSSIEASHGKVNYQSLPILTGDSSQLERALQNLISNALKFRSEQPPVIDVSAQRVGNDWKIIVADNGIGIEAKYQQQIFVPFKRLHGSSKYQGTGIGLASVRKIIERHQGQLGVDSTPGQGSQFWFTLPVSD